MTWDEEGHALLERDASRHRQSFGSFWTKHQSKVHTSERPAVLLKPPTFVDPLDKDIHRRLPSLWEPQGSTEFQAFTLPAFAASSPSGGPSDASSEHEISGSEGDPMEGLAEGIARSEQDLSRGQRSPEPEMKEESAGQRGRQ